MRDVRALLNHLARAPLAVSDDYAAHMVDLLNGTATPMAARVPIIAGRPVPTATVIDRVGIIPVAGPMMRHADPVAEYFGAVSIDSLRASLRAYLESPDVDQLFFPVHCPGGAVAGCTDFAAELYAARGVKPMAMLADTDAYSAAYWVFSACDDVWLTVDGGVGSIATMAVYAEESERLKQGGITVHIFRGAANKAPLTGLEPLSEDAAAEIQADIQRSTVAFERAVARHRGLDVGAIRALRGGILKGQAAVDAGLADKVTTLDGAFLALRKSASTPGRARPAAHAKEQLMAEPDDNKVITIAEAQRMRDAARAEAKDEGKREEQQRSTAITAACTAAEFATLAPGMVARGLTVEQARAELETCEGIRDAAAGGRLSAEQTAGLIAQVGAGLTLAAACKKISTLAADAAGDDIRGRGAVAPGAAAAVIDVAAIYAKRSAQAEAAHQRRYAARH